MADHTLEDCLPEIRRQVKNCPEITLIYALQRAIRIFCKESQIYQKTLTLPLVNDLDVYKLDLSTTDEVIYIQYVQYNQYPLDSQRPEDVYFYAGGDQPFVYYFDPPDLLSLRPIPHNVQSGGPNNGPSKCLVRLVLQPKEGADFIPEVIYRGYKEGLCAGAIAWLLEMPGEVWYNPQLAQLHNQRFTYSYCEARRHRLFGHNSGAIRVKPRSFLNN